MIFQTLDISICICNSNIKDTIETSIFYTKLYIQDLPFFVAVANTGSLKYYLLILKYFYHKLVEFEKKIGWFELTKFWTLRQKVVYHFKHFWYITGVVLKEVFESETINDATLWIKRLQSFIISKIMIVWHV